MGRLQPYKLSRNFLSFAGKITLIKSELASIPINTLSCMSVPKVVIRILEDTMRGFLWSQHGNKRTHWVAWDDVCSPFYEGGLGIRSLQDTIKGLQGKLAWKVYAGDTLWTRMLRQKYGIDWSTQAYTRQQSASLVWDHLYTHFQHFQDIECWTLGKVMSHSGSRIGSAQYWIAPTPLVSHFGND